VARARRFLDEASLSSRVDRVSLARLDEAELPTGRVVAIGGDGTVNAVVTWLYRKGAQCRLGIVPSGTGNNLASGLGVPVETDRACELAFRGETTHAIDLGVYERSGAGAGAPPKLGTFVQSAGVGFHADVAARYDRLRRKPWFRLLARPLGPHIYRWLALEGVARLRRQERRGVPPTRATIDFGAEVIDEPMLAVFIGNERSIGGDFIPCPRARPDDGVLDFCLVRAGVRRSYLDLLRRASRGAHLELEDCVVYRTASESVRLRLSRSAPFFADGDLDDEDTEWTVRVAPSRVPLLVPARDGSR